MFKKGKLEKELSERQSETVRLRKELNGLRSAVLELKVLNEIALAATKITTSEQMLELIVKKSIKAVDAEQGSILTVSKSEDKVVSTMMRQDDDSKLKHNYHISTNITGWVLLNKKPLIIEELSTDKRFSTTKEESKDIHSVLCVPIWFSGRILGILMMINKKSANQFNSTDLDLLSIIAIQAGQLIENHQLQREAFEKSKEVEVAQLEKNKLAEMDEMKTRFFTNISHEFRTPLTLIMGPVKKLINKEDTNWKKEELNVIHKSANRLNELVNQLLDLSKLESGKMIVKTRPENIISLLNGFVLSFVPLAERKKIKLKYNASEEEIVAYIDRDKVEKIINNILSNSFKFTAEGGEVEVNVSTTTVNISQLNKGGTQVRILEIKISDTGIGIPAERIDKIFDRFYQVDGSHTRKQEGTGIGLSLTKELVELHKGRIEVESVEGRGTSFTIKFPLGNEHLKQERIFEAEEEKEITLSEYTIPESVLNDERIDIGLLTETEKPLMLIVEDNKDVRNYIRGYLEKDFRIIEAVDGEDGLSKSIEQIPDLIISDVMMPKMDGFQLCENLKTDERTSHIPLILLTAKSASEDKIEGLETGADDYIMKPFDAEELQVRIKNLIDQRKKLREHFKRKELFELENIDITPVDKIFMQRMVEVIDKNLSDPAFGVESFASELAVSRSLLLKKLVALIGESPSELIKRVRLSRAAKLIENNAGNISEIALEIGFNNPSYFSECFRKQFGESPLKYQQRFKNH
jgi:signal transduction histidine kinase/AraC-like DNA-binding protein